MRKSRFRLHRMFPCTARVALPGLACLVFALGTAIPLHAENLPGQKPWLSGTPIVKRYLKEAGIASKTATRFVPLQASIAAPSAPMAPDSMSFHAFNFDQYFNQGILSQDLIEADLRATGDHSYIFVESSEWGVSVFQAHVDSILQLFEHHTPSSPDSGMYHLDIATFGPVPDEIDNDPRIYILLMDIQDADGAYGGYVAGYFTEVNEFEEKVWDSYQKLWFYSNEVEMMYIDTDPGFQPSQLEFTKGVFAHEFQHMIHWGQDSNELTWLDEACAELAMFICGFPPDDPGGHLYYFLNNPETSLTEWEYNDQGQIFADYGASYLWALYMYEQYGGGGIIRSIVSNTKNGSYSVEEELKKIDPSLSFPSVFTDWTMANYLDVDESDTTFIDQYSYRYTYKNADLHSLGGGIQPTATHSVYEISNAQETIDNWSANYIEFTGVPTESMTIGFDGVMQEAYGVKVATMNNLDAVGVHRILLDSNKDGELLLDGFGDLVEGYDIAVMIPSLQNTSQPQTDSYSSTYAYYTLTSGSNLQESFLVYPNPFGTIELGQRLYFDFRILKTARITIKIFNAAGEGIVTLEDDELPAGYYNEYSWDGKNRNDNFVAPGNYVYIFQVDSEVKTGIICFVR